MRTKVGPAQAVLVEEYARLLFELGSLAYGWRRDLKRRMTVITEGELDKTVKPLRAIISKIAREVAKHGRKSKRV